jgi:tRNA nucleotidyltransferase (CCA-adding enzyme)
VSQHDRRNDLRQRFYAGLSAPVRELVTRVVDEAGSPVYVAGGVVRDLIMGRTSVDVDLVVETDAPELLRRIAERRGAPSDEVTVHERFRTASVEVADTWVDVATARRETYATPGALPDVAPTGIEEDLLRRDFSVNAIALRLTGEPELLDPAGGRRDIAARQVRALHPRSFEDDPTRIFRAFRYAARLGFTVEPLTASWIAASVAYIENVGGERLRRELALSFEDERGWEALEEADLAGALAAIQPCLRWAKRQSSALQAISGEQVAAGFALAAWDCVPARVGGVVERLRLTSHQAAIVQGAVRLRDSEAMLRRPEAKPSGVVVLLEKYPAVSVEVFRLMTRDAIAAELAGRYLAEWRHERPILRGDQLIEMGVPTGPRVHQGLQLLRAARLDGIAQDEGDERALAARFVKSIRDSTAMRGTIEFHNGG